VRLPHIQGLTAVTTRPRLASTEKMTEHRRQQGEPEYQGGESQRQEQDKQQADSHYE
jgi:hypothetical protein